MLYSNYLKQLDLQDIVVFLNLLEQQSAKRTAELMCISQPTVSYCLKRLRTCFDDALFVLSHGILLPTLKAVKIAPYLKLVVESVNRCAENEDSAPASVNKVWRVCAPEYFELSLLPLSLTTLARERANVSFHIERLGNSLPIDRLMSGNIDIAMGFGPGYHQLHPDLQWQSILDDEFVCVTSLLGQTSDKPMNIDDFCSSPHIFPTPWVSEKNIIDGWLEKIGRSRKLLARANSYQACINIVAALPVTLALPARLLPFLLIPEKVIVCKPPLGCPTFTLDMIWAKERSHHEEVFSLRSLIQRVSRNTQINQ
ncbi:LysR substrate-binding domain-containing protein [Samsonia erythrinae]|uniref:DNA-binding transcriptional LysR family regulator n=1 Tax=Samsonia erythrinae TaxID=160434 RepID=A0A4R3VN36_9GAMM|nr:LysR family transcriptional regulator [Samsonia erythrinae]TCV05441.1 DNA-binding transcriptional LysR family regulator [Samsonia erythrinae]